MQITMHLFTLITLLTTSLSLAAAIPAGMFPSFPEEVDEKRVNVFISSRASLINRSEQ